ncbi:universal stress protein [Haloarcula litorea]|uniref:universal stress protein n=1 Tax=Haloarcula litorea TaxID=3032579 RepID=UPI0023E85B59|nr:universal stress protein [Halomicroarcula sp. GDY20]
MSSLLDRVVLPVASEEDAADSARALAAHSHGDVLLLYVVEKAGGAPDKAGVEQREAEAEEMFAAAREVLADADSEIRYGSDVVDTIFEAAADRGASAVVFTPREGSRISQLLTGDLTRKLVTENDRPVVALPDPDRAAERDG